MGWRFRMYAARLALSAAVLAPSPRTLLCNATVLAAGGDISELFFGRARKTP